MKRYRFNTYTKDGGGETFIYEWHRGMMSASKYAMFLMADDLKGIIRVMYEKI